MAASLPPSPPLTTQDSGSTAMLPPKWRKQTHYASLSPTSGTKLLINSHFLISPSAFEAIQVSVLFYDRGRWVILGDGEGGVGGVWWCLYMPSVISHWFKLISLPVPGATQGSAQLNFKPSATKARRCIQNRSVCLICKRAWCREILSGQEYSICVCYHWISQKKKKKLWAMVEDLWYWNLIEENCERAKHKNKHIFYRIPQ